jgi:hypothetical protein
VEPASPSGEIERNALGEESRLPPDLRKHRFSQSFVSEANDRDVRDLVYLGADPEEGARRAGIEAELCGFEIVDQEWDGFVLFVRMKRLVGREATTPQSSKRTVRAGSDPSKTRVHGAAHHKCVVYRAGSWTEAKQRAAADSELHDWIVLEAHWRPAPDHQGGALVLQVEEPES